jgi:hypothetical protein
MDKILFQVRFNSSMTNAKHESREISADQSEIPLSPFDVELQYQISFPVWRVLTTK